MSSDLQVGEAGQKRGPFLAPKQASETKTKTAQNTEFTNNFLLSGPRKFTKSDFSGLAPIRRVLTEGLTSPSLNSCCEGLPREASIFFGRQLLCVVLGVSQTSPHLLTQSRFLGRGCDEALFSETKGFSVKRGEAIQ